MSEVNVWMMDEVIKSVGWFIEDGEIIDDSCGMLIEEYVEMFNEGVEVSFEEGCEKIKEYMRMYHGEDMIEEVMNKLNELKRNRKSEGKWILWNVECDINLGYKE